MRLKYVCTKNGSTSLGEILSWLGIVSFSLIVIALATNDYVNCCLPVTTYCNVHNINYVACSSHALPRLYEHRHHCSHCTIQSTHLCGPQLK